MQIEKESITFTFDSSTLLGFDARVLGNYNAHTIKLLTYTSCIRYFVVLNRTLLHGRHELHKKVIIYPYPSNLSGRLPHLLHRIVDVIRRVNRPRFI